VSVFGDNVSVIAYVSQMPREIGHGLRDDKRLQYSLLPFFF